MTLQQAIDFANTPRTALLLVAIRISMHDEEGTVLVGEAIGQGSMFRPDLPLQATYTLPPPGGVVTRTSGGLVTRDPTPGFSTRGLGGRPNDPASASLTDVTPSGTSVGTVIPIDFSVARNPGSTLLSLFHFHPSVQIQIDTLSAPAPGGTVTGGIALDAIEDGALLRAVGPSLMDRTKRASYAVTILVVEQPG